MSATHLTPAEIVARTAARKAAGVNQTYPRAAAKAPVPKVAVALPVLAPCAHEGDIIAPCHSCGAADRHVRDCEVHGQCTRVEAGKDVDMVCARCPDHSARTLVAALPVVSAPRPPRPPGSPARLLIPQPPPLDLRPARPRAVVTVVVGAEAEACHAAGERHLRAYAARVDADLVVLRWPGHHAWPMSAKFAVGRTLDHYERIAFVDADTLLRPGCVNLFDQCAPDEFGFCDELPWQRALPAFRREPKYQAFRAAMGFAPVASLPWYANTGVMVVPRSHRELLLPPAEPMPVEHCAEQDWIGARLLDSRLPYRLMDRRANWQNWTDPGFAAAPPDAVLHWSGAGRDRRERARQIAEWAARPGAVPRAPRDPAAGAA
jgi:hypothetical protein